MIRLLLVEDNAVVRELVAGLLEAEDYLEVAGQAENGLTALALLHGGLQVDVVLADLNMPGMDGIQLTEKITALYPKARVIILTMHAKATFLKRAVTAGARGYLLKNGDMDELFDAIEKVNAGELVVGTDAN